MGGDLDRLLLVGMSHRTAPVEVREQLALDEAGVRRHLAHLTEGACREALLLSTCNRTELYAVPQDEATVRSWVHEFRSPRGEPIEPYLYWRRGADVVQHLFRVTSALESQIVGEPQILGQVKEAARLAGEARALGRVLHRLVDRSFFVAKRVRTETDVTRHRVGIGNAGVDLALHVFGDLSGQRVMLVGAGEMGREVARALLSAGVAELLVANRSAERREAFAAEHDATAIPFERRGEYLARVDIVIAATGAKSAIFDKSQVHAAIKKRRYRPLVLIDLAVPRNIDPSVSELEEAFLFNVDDLTQVVEQGQKARAAASHVAGAMVNEEAQRFAVAMAQVEIGPRIGQITKMAEALRLSELQRSQRLLAGLDDAQRAAVDRLTMALVKKVLHQPIQAAREAARSGDPDRVDQILSAWEPEE
jgi:glutamyl-tRNA reductase